MSSVFDLSPQPALAGKQPIIREGISLTPLFGGHVIHVLGRSDDNELGALLRDASGGDPLAVRDVSPGQYFIVGDAALTHAETVAIAEKLKPRADIVDQSDGRVRIALRGPMAERVLAKGTAVDLAGLRIGQSAMTMAGHIGAQITRTGDASFEIIVLRGFAGSLWDDLDHMSREFITPAINTSPLLTAQ
jgi:sarcosine oxidase subunit gamma